MIVIRLNIIEQGTKYGMKMVFPSQSVNFMVEYCRALTSIVPYVINQAWNETKMVKHNFLGCSKGLRKGFAQWNNPNFPNQYRPSQKNSVRSFGGPTDIAASVNLGGFMFLGQPVSKYLNNQLNRRLTASSDHLKGRYDVIKRVSLVPESLQLIPR